MKKSMSKLFIAVVLMLLGSLPALAIIDKIEVTQFSPGFMEYQPNETIPVAQGRDRTFRVSGGGTDLASKIEVSGSGIADCPITGRKGGIGSYIQFTCTVQPNATANVRTVTIKYPLGEDTFRIEVMKVGTVSKIEYEPDLSIANTSFGTIGSSTSNRQPTNNLPRNQEITLVITGTKLSNVVLHKYMDYTEGEVLPGATETECKIRVKFTVGGSRTILLVDKDAGERVVPKEFFTYKGSPSNNSINVYVQSSTTAGGGGTFTGVTGGLVGGGTSSGSNFLDVAPRANMLNVFRRLSNFAPFTIGGTTFLTVNNLHCQGMTANQSREITIPDLTWGVTNVGTQAVNQPFQVVLRGASGNILATENVTNLAPGATQNFTFSREKSQVRVRTRSDRQGCFISPNDAPDFYFEDEAFSVLVDSTGALGEDATRRNNNTRNY